VNKKFEEHCSRLGGWGFISRKCRDFSPRFHVGTSSFFTQSAQVRERLYREAGHSYPSSAKVEHEFNVTSITSARLHER